MSLNIPDIPHCKWCNRRVFIANFVSFLLSYITYTYVHSLHPRVCPRPPRGTAAACDAPTGGWSPSSASPSPSPVVVFVVVVVDDCATELSVFGKGSEMRGVAVSAEVVCTGPPAFMDGDVSYLPPCSRTPPPNCVPWLRMSLHEFLASTASSQWKVQQARFIANFVSFRCYAYCTWHSDTHT